MLCVLYVVFTIATGNCYDDEGIIEVPDSLNFEFDAVFGRRIMEQLGEVQIFPKESKMIFPVKDSPVPSFGKNMYSMGQPYIEAYSNNKRMLFHLDTGFSGSDLSAKYYKEHKAEIDVIGQLDTLGIGGYCGFKKMEMYSIPKIDLLVGNTEFTFHNIYVSTDDFEIDNKHGSFGTGFVSLFNKITINFNKMFVDVE